MTPPALPFLSTPPSLPGPPTWAVKAACEAGGNSREGKKDTQDPLPSPWGFWEGLPSYTVRGARAPTEAAPQLPPPTSLLPRRHPYFSLSTSPSMPGMALTLEDTQRMDGNQTWCLGHLLVPSDICWSSWSLWGGEGLGPGTPRAEGVGRLGRSLRGHNQPLPQSLLNEVMEGLRSPVAPHGPSKGPQSSPP